MVCERDQNRLTLARGIPANHGEILATAVWGGVSRNDMAIVHGAALRKWARRSLLLAAILVAPSAYSEAVSQPPEDPGTLLGNYLSGRLARGDHDTLAAAGFYAKALASDPENEIILEQTFLLEAASAHWDRAIKLANDLVKVEPAHRIARFLLGCEAFKQGKYDEAAQLFERITSDDHYVEFLTLPAYELID